MNARRSDDGEVAPAERGEAAAEPAQTAEVPVERESRDPSNAEARREIHADPEAFALRGRPVRAIRFRREIVIGAAIAALLAVTATAWFALRSPGLPAPSEAVPNLPTLPRPSEILAQAPASYDDVPVLGPPLPGDLGRPILRRQRGGPPGRADGASGAGANAAEIERARAAAAALEARKSEVFLPLGGRGQGGASALPGETGSEPMRGTGGSAGAAAPIAAARSPVASSHRILPAPSPWVISGGSVLAASLVTAIDSDRPGLVVAQLTEHAYDSVTGRTLLLPQGSRLIGRYESDLGFGARRVQVV